MTQLLSLPNAQAPTMSSREIATLCDKRHDNVMADVAQLNESYKKMGLLKIQETPYVHEQNGQTCVVEV